LPWSVHEAPTATARAQTKKDPKRGPARRKQRRVKEMSQQHAVTFLPVSHRGRPFTVELHLRSAVSAISPIVDNLMILIRKWRCALGNELNIEIALREAIVNAVIHGNHRDHRKHVYVGCRCETDGGVSIVVRDDGHGFDTNSAPDPTIEGNIQSSRGRGVYLMKALMDEVHFERGGSVVHMRKKSTIPKAHYRGSSDEENDLTLDTSLDEKKTKVTWTLRIVFLLWFVVSIALMLIAIAHAFQPGLS
jgi:serine/threonine-protein kinase RsbW